MRKTSSTSSCQNLGKTLNPSHKARFVQQGKLAPRARGVRNLGVVKGHVGEGSL